MQPKKVPTKSSYTVFKETEWCVAGIRARIFLLSRRLNSPNCGTKIRDEKLLDPQRRM